MEIGVGLYFLCLFVCLMLFCFVLFLGLGRFGIVEEGELIGDCF